MVRNYINLDHMAHFSDLKKVGKDWWIVIDIARAVYLSIYHKNSEEYEKKNGSDRLKTTNKSWWKNVHKAQMKIESASQNAS